jgi:glucokinase
VIAGGVVPRLAPLIGQSALADRIRNGGCDPALTADLPVWLSTDPQAGLRGACAALGNDHLAARCLTG